MKKALHKAGDTIQGYCENCRSETTWICIKYLGAGFQAKWKYAWKCTSCGRSLSIKDSKSPADPSV